jgi:hypothetical protein
VTGEAVGGEYAITGTYPTLDDIIAFKEGTAPFDHGYYRFVQHPAVRRLQDVLSARFGRRHCRLVESLPVALQELALCVGPADGQLAVLRSGNGELPAPTAESAAAQFIVLGLQAAGGAIRAGAVLGSSDRIMAALDQQVMRRGPILSGRDAESLSSGSARAALPAEAASAPARVARALCEMEGGDAAFLYASGMSAITRVLGLLCRPGRAKIIAVGHLYSDTNESLRLGNAVFLGVDEIDALPGLVDDQTAAIFTETITNPLSDVPDLDALSRVARARGVPFVVDNTIATPSNCRDRKSVV